MEFVNPDTSGCDMVANGRLLTSRISFERLNNQKKAHQRNSAPHVPATTYKSAFCQRHMLPGHGASLVPCASQQGAGRQQPLLQTVAPLGHGCRLESMRRKVKPAMARLLLPHHQKLLLQIMPPTLQIPAETGVERCVSAADSRRTSFLRLPAPCGSKSRSKIREFIQLCEMNESQMLNDCSRQALCTRLSWNSTECCPSRPPKRGAGRLPRRKVGPCLEGTAEHRADVMALNQKASQRYTVCSATSPPAQARKCRFKDSALANWNFAVRTWKGKAPI